uniref:EGF-like domain-containing protein n=1 Tax=Parastrongyloides trichosuri TaxID=131310 RepID=A0A0N4ZSX8_PARTI
MNQLYKFQIILLLYAIIYNINIIIANNLLISSEIGTASIFDPNHPFSVKQPFSSRNIIKGISDEDSEVTFTKVVEKSGSLPSVSHHTARNVNTIKGSNKRLQTNITSFTIKCCNGGYPIPINSSIQQNFIHSEADYEIEEIDLHDTNKKESNVECKLYNGNFTIKKSIFIQSNTLNLFNVSCKCKTSSVYPEVVLDSSCLELPKCLNHGYRSFHSNNRCKCPQPYFGKICEKKCVQGSLYKDQYGNDICNCLPYYQGSECTEIICLNGGTRIHDRCSCQNQFLGYHCEIDTNRTVINPRTTRYGETSSDVFSRDVSGTVFSLVMIIVLVISMYLLMKHRMQSQNRYVGRRPDLLGGYIVSMGGSSSCSGTSNVHGYSHRRDMYQIEGCRGYQFRSMVPLEGPPAYYTHEQRRVRRGEILPPLPSYEDATKLPPLRSNDVNVNENDESTQNPIINNHSNEIQEQDSTLLLSPSELSPSIDVDEDNRSVISKPLSLDNESIDLQITNIANQLSTDKVGNQGNDNGSISSQINIDSKGIKNDTDKISDVVGSNKDV